MGASRTEAVAAAARPGDPLLWAGLAAVWLFDVWAARAVGISISGGFPQVLAAGLLLGVGCCVRARGTASASVATLFEGLAALTITPVVFAPLSYIATRSPHAPVDAYLRAADAMVGFDAVAFRDFVMSRPRLAWASGHVYMSFLPQCLLAVFVLPMVGDGRRGLMMFRAASAALAVCCLSAYLFPAIGTVPALEDCFVDWHALRNLHTPFVTDAGHVESIISCPSFHAATAVILGYSFRGLGAVSWVMGALNVAMCVAAIPDGFHYLTDIVAGVLLAAACLYATRERAYLLRPPSAVRRFVEA